jgi:hypothetical protein
MNLSDEFSRCMEAMNQYNAERAFRQRMNSQKCGVCKMPTIVTEIRPNGPDSGTVGWKCTNCGEVDGPKVA